MRKDNSGRGEALKNPVYIDNNATTAVAPEAFNAMKPFLTEKHGNPSSIHSFGGGLRTHLEQARHSVARLIGASDPSEVIFTSCGTESDNTAIMSALRSFPEKRHIVTTEVEHPAVLTLCETLENDGYDVTYLPVDLSGQIDLEQLRESVSERTALVSIMYANNETGVVFPIKEIAEIAKEKNALFHTDAVQAVGKEPIEVKNLSVDMLSISGHKIHAPKGVGALYVRNGTDFTPFLLGGHQEFGRRAGTENIASIAALGAVCDLIRKNMHGDRSRISKLRDRLEYELMDSIADTRVNGDTSRRLCNTTNIGFEFVEGESILLMMDQCGIAASSGSACTSGSLTPSHVLKSMKVPFSFIQGSVRFSLSRYTTDADIDHIVKHLPPIICKLREISPYGKKF